jgi:hypothetical protein
MPPHRRLRAPAGNGEVLADPGLDAIPALVEANRRRLDRADVVIGGLPLRELRALARREVLDAAREYTQSPPIAMGGLSTQSLPVALDGLSTQSLPVALDGLSTQSPPIAMGGHSTDAPLLLAGHQPELPHPGVWVKHFALSGLARKLGGTPLHLIVDNDTLKSTSLRFPVFRDHDPASVHLQSVPFDKLDGETPYEDRRVLDPNLFDSFAERAAPLWRNWGYEPLLAHCWTWASGGPVGARPRPGAGGGGGAPPPRSPG